MMWNNGWNNGMGWGGWIMMTLVMVAFWSIVVLGVVAMFRGTRDAGPVTRNSGRGPMEILDERFARGEIEAYEYHARQDVLRTADRRPAISP